MQPKQEINKLFEQAEKIALAEVEKLARDILRKHPNLDEFVMGMGGWFFTLKEKHAEIRDSVVLHDRPAYMLKLENFISEFDEYLKITGNPIRFTADSPIKTDW